MVLQRHILGLSLACCLVFTSISSGSLIAWTAELNGNNGSFAIDNQSMGAFSIRSVTFDMTGTTGGVTLDSTNITMHSLGIIGSFNTQVTDPTLIDFSPPGGLSNDIPFIKTTIGTAGNLFTFNFEPGSFASGEGWGLDDMIYNRTGGGAVTRANMSGANISVLFWEHGTALAATYSQSDANGGSFPIQASAVPEPSSIGLCTMIALAIGSTNLRRRK